MAPLTDKKRLSIKPTFRGVGQLREKHRQGGNGGSRLDLKARAYWSGSFYLQRSQILRGKSPIDCPGHRIAHVRGLRWRVPCFPARPNLTMTGSGLLGDAQVLSVGMALAESAQPFQERRQMSEVHEPGGIVKTSGIYKVVNEGDGSTTFEVMWVGGERFQLTRSGKWRALRTGACGHRSPTNRIDSATYRPGAAVGGMRTVSAMESLSGGSTEGAFVDVNADTTSYQH